MNRPGQLYFEDCTICRPSVGRRRKLSHSGFEAFAELTSGAPAV
jgi:hypothetical protein